jgi:uncharacterized ParB-like nuclease family protein
MQKARFVKNKRVEISAESRSSPAPKVPGAAAPEQRPGRMIPGNKMRPFSCSLKETSRKNGKHMPWGVMTKKIHGSSDFLASFRKHQKMEKSFREQIGFKLEPRNSNAILYK